ncbi:HAD family hydrolase [Lachnoclostridium sp. Marseille-P6806]|uniref:HAD family hydrolase n=1 Tax=Lachnoclostridium sp. Marseille-P6806 TaxID=2364793 RepID=UPI001031CCBC|nr:HAD family phosphatase [Lachnoclostridium sp. Marseille-P6806]
MKDRSFKETDSVREPVFLYECYEELQAVLFDLDGTLVDSMWMWRAIDIEYLARYDVVMPDGLQEELGGRSMRETAVYFRERFGIPDEEEIMMADWNDMARRKYAEEVPLKPYALDFLQWCRSSGLRLGIATSNSRELTETVLSAHGIADHFDTVVTGDEALRGKPAPDIYLTAAKRLGVSPERCMVFEDVPDGIRAGKAAGMYVTAVEDLFSAGQRAEKQQLADCYIRDYRELLGGAIREESEGQ